MIKKLLILLILIHPPRLFAQGSTPLEQVLRQWGPADPVSAKIVAWYAPANGNIRPGSRIISAYTSLLENNGSRWMGDSTIYSYTNGRGGDLTTPRIDYSTKRTITNYGQRYEEITTQRFDARNRPDMWSRRSRWDEDTFANTTRTSDFYNSKGMKSLEVREYWKDSAWLSNRIINISYDSAGRTRDSVIENWNFNTRKFDSGERYTMAYGASGRLSALLGTRKYEYMNQISWDTVVYRSYRYDASGNMAESFQLEESGPFDWAARRNRYSYDAATRSAIQVTEIAVGPTKDLILSPRDSIVVGPHYGNPAIPVITQYGLYGSPEWRPARRYSLLLNANGSPVVGLTEQWETNAWQDYWRNRFEYNEFNQLTRTWVEVLEAGIWRQEPRAEELRYTYESYQPLGTGSALKNETAVLVYPNPAADRLRISIAVDVLQPLQLQLSDAAGRTLRTWNEQAAGEKTVFELDTKPFAAGTYFISVRSSAGVISKRFSILR